MHLLPQVASIGKTEKKLKEEGPTSNSVPIPSVRKAASGQPEGFVKLLVDKKCGEILGAHIVGADATEMIAEYGLGMKLEVTAEEIHNTIHAHPTMSEAIWKLRLLSSAKLFISSSKTRTDFKCSLLLVGSACSYRFAEIGLGESNPRLLQ